MVAHHCNMLKTIVFVLYSPKKLKFEPGEKKIVDIKLNIKFSTNLTGSCRLELPLGQGDIDEFKDEGDLQEEEEDGEDESSSETEA